jgi:hypothetical protein
MASRAKMKASRWTEIGPLHIFPEIVEDFGGQPREPEKGRKPDRRPKKKRKPPQSR